VEQALAESIVKVLNQGLLGVAAVVEGYVIWKLYQAKEAQRQSMEASFAAERQTAREEYVAFRDRYDVKAENWGEKQTALAEAVTRILESAEKKQRDPR
jgi:hypothetical protein